MTASAIYNGRMRHTRLAPKRREFSYRIYMMYLDLAELPELFDGRWLWSATRTAPMRFRREDYYGDPSVPLDQSIRDLIGEHTDSPPTGPVRLLTNLRSFGYIFNPISVYYVFSDDGDRLTHVVADVTNIPWRESHPYVFEAGSDGLTVVGTAEKVMHVSPFLEMDYIYRLVASRPGEKLDLSVSNSRDGKVEFSASLRMTRRELTVANLRGTLARHPAMAIGVTMSIFAQAIRMKLRGFKWYGNPSSKGTAKLSDPIEPFDSNSLHGSTESKREAKNEASLREEDHVSVN